ncbi:MAG: cytoplasmic protein [Desulfobaccales bacterium]
MGKYALFAFNGEAMCFVHVLLNGLDLKAKGAEVKIIFEGAACRLVAELGVAGHPFHLLYAKARDQGLFDGICQACAQKMGSLEAARVQGLTILKDMSGHAGMAPYLQAGYTIITF